MRLPRTTFLQWLVVAALCTFMMWARPGEETAPYHVAWAAFALLYGLAPWPTWQTSGGLGAFTVVTGAILVHRAATAVIPWQEIAEVPLMLLLMLLMVWHVRRRQLALADVTVLAAREREESRSRELLTQRTSHEMRSPLTIARGYLEVLMGRPRDPEELAELRTVDEELARLTRVCERLVRQLRVHGDVEQTAFDADAVLVQAVRRWSTVADRNWVVSAHAGTIHGSTERLRACLDTVIENAIRYTGPHDTIRVFGSRDAVASTTSIGVADSGPGLSKDLVEAVNGAQGPGRPLERVRDELSQTGLGFGLVLEVLGRRGGLLRLGRAPEGGALITMVSPVRSRVAPTAGESDEVVAASSRHAPRAERLVPAPYAAPAPSRNEPPVRRR
jgi:signal transduction histidine kinase